jgi:7,8-dihydroneopterin aldolase/epimerase/oxygenase
VWDPQSSYHKVALEGVAVEVRIGAFAGERRAPQTVLVDVELFRHGAASAAGGLADCLDYDQLYRYLTTVWPTRPHTDLLEELGEDLVAFCLSDPRVEACRVTVRKPGIYPGTATPAVEIYRLRG